MNHQLGFGIIGAGVVAPYIAKGVINTPDAKLIAIADVVEDKARQLAQTHQADWYTDYHKLLEHPDIDVIAICTPSGLHSQLAIDAAQAKKHILVEKPLEITLGRCDQMIKAAQDAGVKLGVVFQSRFLKSSQKLKAAIDSGKLGKLILCDVYIKWYRTQEYYDSGGWRGTWELDGGGCLMNQGIHGIDLLQWFGGPVASVYAHTDIVAHKRIEVEDIAVALLKFQNDAFGVIEGATSAYPGFPTRHEIHGSEGSVILDEDDRILKWEFRQPTQADKTVVQEFWREELKVDRSDPTATLAQRHLPVVQDIVEAIKGDREPAVTGTEGRKSVEIILAIYKSAKEGQPINLPL